MIIKIIKTYNNEFPSVYTVGYDGLRPDMPANYRCILRSALLPANLRDRCHITREGVSLLGISDAAESIGLRSVGVKLTWQQLRDEANFPCIVHWNQRHFVVVYKIEKKRGQWWVYVSDPAVGLLKYSERQFLKSWLQTGAEDSVLQGDLSGDSSAKGIALLLEPKPEFYAEKGDEDKRLNFASMLRYLRPYKSYLLQLGLAMLIAAVLGLILPFLTQSVVDTGIGNSNLSFVVMILIAQVVLTLGQMANNLIRSWLMLHMTTRISISLISDFLAKLMRLPIAFSIRRWSATSCSASGITTGSRHS